MSYYTTRQPTHADQAAATNLDQDLHLSRDAKYQRTQGEIVRWVFSTLAVPQAEQDAYAANGCDLVDVLKDGLLLCRLGDRLLPTAPTRRSKSSRMPFVQMENILFFLQLCESVGVAHDEIFQTVDLYERKDPYQVVVTLMSFSRRAREMAPDKFSVIGPKVVKVKPQVPRKPIALRK